jgi:hypothetical protein
MHVIRVHHVVLTIEQSENDRDAIAVLVMRGAQKHGSTCTRYKTSGTDGRLSFNDLDGLFCHTHIMYRTWTVKSHRILIKYLSVGVVGLQIGKYGDLALFNWRMFLCIF